MLTRSSAAEAEALAAAEAEALAAAEADPVATVAPAGAEVVLVDPLVQPAMARMSAARPAIRWRVIGAPSQKEQTKAADPDGPATFVGVLASDYMPGQFAVPAPPAPPAPPGPPAPVAPEGGVVVMPDAAGAVGVGVAALTAATPPIARRPTASNAVATARPMARVARFGAEGLVGAGTTMSAEAEGSSA